MTMLLNMGSARGRYDDFQSGFLRASDFQSGLLGQIPNVNLGPKLNHNTLVLVLKGLALQAQSMVLKDSGFQFQVLSSLCSGSQNVLNKPKAIKISR
ncbi:hypothetical protein CEXT_230921 [Caerostris extrusa]|uniref:Uncharacterized protein n=1 Tax=Caerostris extrusa TaxID=172846 RepID=A0AAV4RN57_CAEEX|nr:hypothetical protein CEXT_230921 [Caerostris extrusa]